MKNIFQKSLLIALFSITLAHAEKVVKLSLETVGEENIYKPNVKGKKETRFTVAPGAKIELTLKNNSKSMQHNFVLVKPGKESSVGIALMGAAPNFAKAMPDVIAFFPELVAPQKSGKLEFTAPTEKGDYPFICTFPGHFQSMKGVLTVK